MPSVHCKKINYVSLDLNFRFLLKEFKKIYKILSYKIKLKVKLRDFFKIFEIAKSGLIFLNSLTFEPFIHFLSYLHIFSQLDVTNLMMYRNF